MIIFRKTGLPIKKSCLTKLFLHLFLIRDDVPHPVVLRLVGEVVAELRDGRSVLGVVEMGVYAFGRRYRRMAEELLDVLHRDARVPQHRRAGMPQVMESDNPKLICFQEFLECTCHPVHSVSRSVLSDVDIVVVLVVVHAPERLLPFLLLRFHV